jgi:protein-S-isoprenylcysteine O-methyltransferase Ste14
MSKHLIIKLIIFLIAVIAAIYASSFTFPTRLIIGIALGVPSLVLLITSRVQLGKSFAATAKAKALVTTGIYSKILHPLYLFIDLLIISIIIISGIPLLLIVPAILFIAQLVQSRREEKVLLEAFGKEYEEYKARTWF